MSENPVNLDELFSGTTGVSNIGKIAVVGESWGDNERRAGQPFVGESGKELTRMLADAGISRFDCFLTNVCSRQPPANDMRFFFMSSAVAKKEKLPNLRGLYPDPETRKDLARLHKQLAFVRPRVIVALGNYALWALTQNCFSVTSKEGWKIPTGIASWRGSYLEWNTWDAIDQSRSQGPAVPVIPTFHPAAVLRSWEWRQPAVLDLRTRVAPLAKGMQVPDPQYSFLVAPTLEQVLHAFDTIDALPDGSWITSDVETRGDQLACVGIAWSPRDAVCIPFADSRNDTGTYWSTAEETVLRGRLEKILDGKRLRLSNQNINYDRQYLYRYLFIKPTPSHDTMVAHHVAWPGTPKGLGYLSSLYCRYHRYWKDEGKTWEVGMDEKILWEYNCKDCVTTWEITQVEIQMLKSMGLYDLYLERMEVLEVAFEMMIEEITIDRKERDLQIAYVMAEMDNITRELSHIVPGDLAALVRGKTSKSEWYTSPAQTQSLFYDLFGVPEIRNPKTKQRTIDDDALQRIALGFPILEPIVHRLQDLRSLGVILSNFLRAPLEPATGKMRTTWDTTGTVSFRWASKENAFWRGTNLMNIAKEKDQD